MEVNVALLCLRCGAEGTVIMDRGNPVCAESSFYLRVPLHFDRPPEIVCRKCGAVHPRPRLSTQCNDPSKFPSSAPGGLAAAHPSGTSHLQTSMGRSSTSDQISIPNIGALIAIAVPCVAAGRPVGPAGGLLAGHWCGCRLSCTIGHQDRSSYYELRLRGSDIGSSL